MLVVWKLDRLGRNLAHPVNTVQELSAREVGVRLLAGDGAQIDTTPAAGRLVFGIFAALAGHRRHHRLRVGGQGAGETQANKRLAEQTDIGRDRLYFNIARVGTTSAASIPLVIHDAVREGVLSTPTPVFTPRFGAGAVAGYAALRIAPPVVAPARLPGRRWGRPAGNPVRRALVRRSHHTGRQS